MHDYFVEGKELKASNLLFVITNKYLIVASSSDTRYYREIFEDILDNLKENRIKDVGYILYNFLQEDVEDNYRVLEKTEEEISALEREVSHYEKGKTINVERIISLKRKLFRISRQFWASTKIITALRSGTAHVKLDEESKAILWDIHETFLHQIDVATSQKDMLSDALSVYSTNISNRLAIISNELNVIMKRLAAFALILMVPTLIASAYGMNFRYIPFAATTSGFNLTVAAMLSSAVIIAIIFRAKKWL
jgi:magnesium transporter